MEIFIVAKKLWMKLNLRGMIVVSLSLQVALIFLAPIRKRSSRRGIILLTWSAYLVADWVADYAFGLISKAQITAGTSNSEAAAYADLLAFWAPFLLLHLGGPDTITAFALEDNELWRRHLLNLLFQLGVAGYVFYQSLPSNKLIGPTILMFIGGLIKYIERTYALWLGSFSKFRDSLLASDDAGPNYAKLMEEYSSKKEANIPASIKMTPEPEMESPGDEAKSRKAKGPTTLDDREVIKEAFNYFSTYKGLLVDLIFSFRQRNETMKFFRSRTFEDAFRVIETELNFFYDVLYTKAAVIHYLTGYIFRAISICSVIIAFALFHVLDKHGFHEYDIRITYALLHGAIGLEFVALSMLICSDWTIAFLGRYEEYRIGKTVIEFLVKLKSKSSSMPIFYSRWSKSIFQYNLIDSQLRRLPKWIEKPLHHISLKEFFNDLKSGRQEPYTDELGKLIFDVLIQMSYAVGDSDSIKKMCATRGKWALEKKEDCKDLLSFVSEVDYGESLLLWHIATELCYNKDEDTNFYSKTRKKTSKILSDYMLYLMIKQPNMMSTVAGIGQIRFRDTCAEMHKFISEKFFAGSKTIESVCQSLLVVPTDVKPADVKGDRSKSVLFDACILAKELDKIEETKWEIVSEVWVELLVYAAIHCRPYNHAQQLSKGGELLTLIWLLTVHLGLSEQFQIVEGHARAKLLVEK